MMRKKLVVTAGFVLMTAALFTACGNNKNKAENSTTAAYYVHTDENGETYTHMGGEENTENTAKEDKDKKDTNKEITNSEAADIIKKFSAKKLGLKGKKKNYSFLTATESKNIDGTEYFEVIAAKKTENEDGTVSIDPKGKYYVTLDGSKCFKRDDKTGEMDELK